MAPLTPDPVPGADKFPAIGTIADPLPVAPEGQRAGGAAGTPEIGSQALEKRPDDLPERAEIPWTGEVIDLGNPEMVARALDDCRLYKREVIDPLIRGLERVVTVMVETVGSATLRSGEYQMTAPAKRSYTRNLEAIRDGLLGAGCPQERVDEVIKQTITLSADTRDLDRLAKANKEYGRIIAEHTVVEERPRSVSVKRVKDAGA